MTRSEVKNILLQEFLSGFNQTTAITLSNRNNFYYSTGTSTAKPQEAPWVKFWIQNIQTVVKTIGAVSNRRFDRYGMIAAQVFLPENIGTSEGDILCDEIIEIFEGKRFGQIVCEDGYYRETGQVEDGYFTYDVTIYFYFQETK